MSPTFPFASDLLLDMGRDGALVALLVCGHALGDFVFQTGRMVRHKRETRWLLYHGLEVMLIQGAFLIPFFSPVTLGVMLGIGLSHVAIDRWKANSGDGQAQPLLHFLLDQVLHLVVLAAAWLILTQCATPLLPLFEPYTTVLTVGALGVAAYGFNCNGGAALVGLLLHSYGLPGKDDGDPDRTLRRGRMIGILERMILLTLVLLDQWGALGLILAAKSLARCQDLNQRAFSEYYLIGTLTSVLVAVASGLAVKILV